MSAIDKTWNYGQNLLITSAPRIWTLDTKTESDKRRRSGALSTEAWEKSTRRIVEIRSLAKNQCNVLTCKSKVASWDIR